MRKRIPSARGANALPATTHVLAGVSTRAEGAHRTGHDAPEPKVTTITTPGRIQPGKIGIYKRDHLVAQVGHLATEVTCRRFGVEDAVFKNGAWPGK